MNFFNFSHGGKLVPVKSHGRKQLRKTIERLKIFGTIHTLGHVDWKSLRDEGRRS